MNGITQRNQLTLGELIDWLERQDSDAEVLDGFGAPHSDRGDYSELAFDPVSNTTYRRMLSYAKSADGCTFEGWKGGNYTMCRNTPVYIGKYGECGEPISTLTLSVWAGQDMAQDTIAKLEAARDRLHEALQDLVFLISTSDFYDSFEPTEMKRARAVLQEDGDEG